LFTIYDYPSHFFFAFIAASHDSPRSVAFRITAATPELFAGIDAFFRHTFYHGFAAKGTCGRISLHTLLPAIGQTLSGETFSKSAFHSECIQLIRYLAAYHENQPITKHQQTIGNNERIVALEPRIELMLLGENVNAALMLHIVLIERAV